MKTSYVVGAIIAGLAAGAIVGILYAPDKGSNTRAKLGDASGDLSKKLKDGFNDVVDTVLNKYGEAKDKWSEVKKDYADVKDDVLNLKKDGKSKMEHYSM